MKYLEYIAGMALCGLAGAFFGLIVGFMLVFFLIAPWVDDPMNHLRLTGQIGQITGAMIGVLIGIYVVYDDRKRRYGN